MSVEPQASEVTVDKPSWKMRRYAIFGWLGFCALAVAYIIVAGDPDNILHTKGLTWAFGSAAATVFTYAGWATIEDISLFKLFK